MDELRAAMPPALLSVLHQRFGTGGVGMPGPVDMTSPPNAGLGAWRTLDDACSYTMASGREHTCMLKRALCVCCVCAVLCVRADEWAEW